MCRRIKFEFCSSDSGNAKLPPDRITRCAEWPELLGNAKKSFKTGTKKQDKEASAAKTGSFSPFACYRNPDDGKRELEKGKEKERDETPNSAAVRLEEHIKGKFFPFRDLE